MADAMAIPDPSAAAPGAAGGSDPMAGRIADLEDALARERAKNQVLMEQILTLEDGQASTDVNSFSDVIPNAHRSYWRDRLLQNRSLTIAELNEIRMQGKKPAAPAAPVPPAADDAAALPDAAAVAPLPPPGAAPASKAAPRAVQPKPLHNRAAAAVPAASAFGGPGVVAVSGDKAVWLRNRAQAILKQDAGSYTKAFARAEAELKALPKS